MVKYCCVEGCVNKWGTTVDGKKVGFFKIPRTVGKQANVVKHFEWLAAINRENWKPHVEDVVCGVHFLTGQPNNDPRHPDYRPQIFKNRNVDLQKLKDDLADWEKIKDKTPPVIEIQPKKETKQILPKIETKQQFILPKGHIPAIYSVQQQLLNHNQPSTTISQQVNTTTSSILIEPLGNGLNTNSAPSSDKIDQLNTYTTPSPLSNNVMPSIRIDPLENLQQQDLTNKPNSENTVGSTLSLKPMDDVDCGTISGAVLESSDAGSDSVKKEPVEKMENQSISNGKVSENDSTNSVTNSGSEDIKVDSMNSSLNQSTSAAALMSALATTAGLEKSVGTCVNFSDSSLNGHDGIESKEDVKDAKVEELSEGVISKAIIKTPVKIKNSGDDSIRFMTQYMCRYCAQRFDSWTKMQEHVQAHIKGKNTNHTCSVCGKEYRTPSKLQRHVRVHSGERPYACTVCGRRFTRSDHVKQHMKVHLPPQELNVCRLCGTRFLKRQSLQLHLQQAHLVNQLFTCNRCGEAFESLEQLNAHNLTHDAILNSMNSQGNTAEESTLQGLAKFSVGPAIKIKQVDPSAKYVEVKKEKKASAAEKATGTPSVSDTQYNYVLTLDAPENQEDITKVSDKLIAESIEEESKKYEEIKRQIEEHAKLMAEETLKKKEELEKESKRREEDEKLAALKIAEAFNIGRPDNSVEEKEDDSMDVSEYENPTVLTSEDGMSMYISPDLLKRNDETVQSNLNSDGSDSNANEIEDTDMKETEENNKGEIDEVNDLNKESKKVSPMVIAGHNKAYRPGPLWFKTAQEIHRNALHKQSDKILNIPKVDASTIDSESDLQPKMVSCIKPSINELLKAKVEQKNLNVTEKDQNINSSIAGYQQQRPVPIAPRQVQQYILVSPPQQNTAQVMPQTQQKTGMLRCDHCCIWFEDRAMSLLHNTLHNADETDPFTCRKCYKKLGNRLEFMAHLVWHLEPNMDI